MELLPGEIPLKQKNVRKAVIISFRRSGQHSREDRRAEAVTLAVFARRVTQPEQKRRVCVGLAFVERNVMHIKVKLKLQIAS